MKLSAAQRNAVKDNLDLNVIDETQDVQKELENILGEHTFFLNDSGLFVFLEHANQDQKDKTARLHIVAAWSNDEKKELASIEPPKEIDVIIDLADGKIMSGK